jgi:hypothetical protein
MNQPTPVIAAPVCAGPEIDAPEQARMVAALAQWLGAPRGGVAARAVEVVQTHISFVLLAGGSAYKIRKALDLGFLDFRSLASRRFDCDEELRLNRRLAPALYLGVLPVTGPVAAPALDGDGAVLDWAVQMRAFPQDVQWDRAIVRGALEPRHIDELADLLWPFHRDAPVWVAAAAREPTPGFGLPAAVRAPALECLMTLDVAVGDAVQNATARAALVELAAWEARAFGALRGAFARRLRDGHIREVHGDLHLGNVTQLDGRCTVFDCIEFNPALRWIDVASDIAFMSMDLHAHGRADLANRFVNAWLERSGDHAGVRVLRYHLVYRALVRAKVAALRAAQIDATGASPAPVEHTAALAARDRYLGVAQAFTRPPWPTLMLTHGFSGSGKTSATQSLIERCGAIRVRADVERKRLFGVAPNARSDAALKAALYADAATEATHARLRQAARVALRSGFSVILDATFLRHAPRAQARALATELGARFVIIDFLADAQTLRERVCERAARGDDASEADLAVLEAQFIAAEPLRVEEQADVFPCDTSTWPEPGVPGHAWDGLLARLGA